MSHLNPGLISAYNSLTDKHLAGYFSNTRIRRHLQRAGLITRSGRIVPDKEYRHKLIQRAHQRHIRECLAHAIFHKVLEMERLHQKEIKRKLEEYARRERVHKIKVERSKRCEEDMIRILSPRPPMGARAVQKQYSGPEGEPSESSESPSSSRPNTAPGKMQRPVRLKPIHNNNTTMSVRRSSPYRLPKSSQEHDQSFNCTVSAVSKRYESNAHTSPHNGISPYCLPVINNFVTPVPPTTTRQERGSKVSRSTFRGRRLRSTTTSSGADVTEDLPLLRSSVQQSKVFVTMVYFGKSVHLSHDLTDMRDDVKVFQQHCGGENLCVFKGKLCEGEMFQFSSRRHRGFPFSLTFFLNGLQVERLSSCCEFKHRKGSRLGGKHGHFGFSGVEGASPCYKCIISMGLDKVPTPPSRKMKENGGRNALCTSSKVRSEMLAARTGGYTTSHSECETSQPPYTETQVKEETACDEDKIRDEYEEDFEADDEGPAEEGEEKEKNSPSPFSENKKQVEWKETSETEDDQKDAHSSSSSLNSDQERSDDDTTKDEDKEKPAEIIYEETVAQTNQMEEPELAAATESDLATAKDSDIRDSVEDSTEIDITDTSLLTGREKRQSLLSSEDKDTESIVEQKKQEEEREKAKSVQEKLVEAILRQSHCSSEPELSDTSTEESVDDGPKQNNKDAIPEKLITLAEQQQMVAEKTEFEDVVAGESGVSQDQEEEEKDEILQDAQENNESIKDEATKMDEKTTEEEATAERCEDMESTGEAQHPVDEEAQLQEDVTMDLLEEAPAASSNDETLQNKVVNDGEALEEATTRHQGKGHGAESKEGDESLVLEANKEMDETAVTDNAAEEAATSETMHVDVNPIKEQEDLLHEESAETITENRQQEIEDGASEANAGSSNSTAEESEDSPTTVEKTIATKEENIILESTQNGNNKETEEFKVEGRRDGSESEVCETGEEHKSVRSEEKEKKIFEEEDVEDKEEQSHVNTDQSERDETENLDKPLKESMEGIKSGKKSIENKTVEDQHAENTLDKEEGVTDGNVIEPEKTEEANTSVQKEDMNSENNEDESQSEIMIKKTDEHNEGTSSKDEVNGQKEKLLDEHAKDVDKIIDDCEIEAENTIEEILENISGAGNIPPRSERTNDNWEKGLIDGENGEISAESKTCENKEFPLGDKQDVSDLTKCEEGKTKDPDGHESTEEGGDVSQDREAGGIESSVGEEESKAEECHEQSKNISDPESRALDLRSEDRKDSRETEDSENGMKFSLDNENQESSLTEKNNNTKSSSSAVTESSGHQEQFPPVSVNSGELLQHLEDKNMKPVERSEGPEENVVSVDFSAADGGNEDTEDASKASEEGASVLLKPQNEEADGARQEETVGKGPPEAAADSSDLVTNWVNMHQSSKFFETFVEPLEDLSEIAETPSSEMLMVELTEVGRISDSEDKMHMLKDQSESSLKTTMEAVETDLNNTEPKKEPSQNDCAKDTQQQDTQNTEVQKPGSKAGSEQSKRESPKELDMKPSEVHRSMQAINDDVQDSTEVENISSTHNSEVSGKAESVSETEPVERTAGNPTDMTDEQTVVKERKDLLLATKIEEFNNLNHPDELKDDTTQEMIKDQSEKVSQMTHFTTKSDVGSLQESLGEEIPPEVSEEGRKEMIQDLKHALSREHLSTFSVDKSLFGHNSYSLLPSMRTESELTLPNN
ncbi:glutamate-rich protein 3 [Gouania willdenowi]|uniref:glutamate-rich protein 3 n=1 Tax=Gouania willdenowi TaxID=441366 RepID=UPI0010542CC1|nr:glutamate-rich protein 3 [Gouania willdenowi]